MPEYNECLADYVVVHNWFTTASCSFLLQDIYVDATKAEASKLSAPPLAKKGLPYPLKPGSKVQRGSKNAQGYVFPRSIKHPLRDISLKLVGVHFHPRNVILQLASSYEGKESYGGEWWMQIQLLTHTVAQIYDAEQWHKRMSQVPKDQRGFYIGMALDFGEYFLGFLTLDNLFKVYYGRRRDELIDAPQHDIYLNFQRSLDEIVGWAQSRTKSDRSGLAVVAIRKANKVFLGVGVYTVVELFHLAGLLPFLTEEEVFENPSRAARFVTALFVWAAGAHANMKGFLQPFLRDGNFFLSVTNDDRLDYKNTWLNVYGKARTSVPARWKDQLSDLQDWLTASHSSIDGHTRSSKCGFFDIFEPTYLQLGLERDHNLGSLIFGNSYWQSIGRTVWDNPLSQYFGRRGLLASPTFLHDSVYHFDSLYLTPNDLKKSWTESYLYTTDTKPFWCAVGNLPSKSLPWSSHEHAIQPNVVQAAPSEKKKDLLETIIKFSKEYGVGPLDYCGIARFHRNRIFICRNDPAAPDYFKLVLEAHFDRRRHVEPGKHKGANPAAAKRKQAMMGLRAASKENHATNLEEEHPPKRRRISSDKKLILAAAASVD